MLALTHRRRHSCTSMPSEQHTHETSMLSALGPAGAVLQDASAEVATMMVDTHSTQVGGPVCSLQASLFPPVAPISA